MVVGKIIQIFPYVDEEGIRLLALDSNGHTWWRYIGDSTDMVWHPIKTPSDNTIDPEYLEKDPLNGEKGITQ